MRRRTKILAGAGALLGMGFVAVGFSSSPKHCDGPGDIKITGSRMGCLVVSNATSKKLIGDFTVVNATNRVLPAANINEDIPVALWPHTAAYVSLGPFADYEPGPYRVGLCV